jgi:enoyl-CoA hydratase
MGLIDEACEPGKSFARAAELAALVLEKPKHSVLMTKETVNAYAALGAHAVSYMAHDQLELAAASPESRAAREAAVKRTKT